MFGDRERKRLVNELESKGICRNKPCHLYVYGGGAGEEGKIIRELGCRMCKTVKQAKDLWSKTPLRSFYIFEYNKEEWKNQDKTKNCKVSNSLFYLTL